MAGERWANKGQSQWGPPSGASVLLTVDRASPAQQIFGFGGALTDTSAVNYQLMNTTSRARFLDAYWGRVDTSATSLGYTLHRVAINSPDYANITFNLDDVTDDFDLKHFDSNLTYDRKHVLPLIHDVRAAVESTGGKAHFFASPWSPPGWMKGNGNMISSSMPCLKPDTAGGSYAQAWAAYIVKWLQAFEAVGVKFWGLTTQNEMFANQSSFESCTYTAEDMRDWLRDHLGPALHAVYPDLAIMVYDHNKVAAPAVVATIMADPAAAAFVAGTAIHWYDYMGDTIGFAELVNASALGGPTRFVLATEACIIQNLTETWSAAEMYALDILADLNAGAVGWVEWNVLLHYSTTMYGRGVKRGGPNHTGSRFGSAMLLWQDDSGCEELVFQPTFFAIGHVSRFVRPGWRRVKATGPGFAATGADYDAVLAHAYRDKGPSSPPLVASAFQSEDGRHVAVVVLNAGDAEVDYELFDSSMGVASAADASAVRITAPAHSIQTLLYDAPSPIPMA